MIKYLVLDIDGTLTDGMIYVGHDGEIMKAFNIKDGYGIAMILPERGILPIVITGRRSEIVEKRSKELNIEHCFQDVKDKLETLQKFLSKQGGGLSECAYMGDDLNDKPCMDAVRNAGGLVGCPADACDEIRMTADFVAPHDGGRGAVRDFIEYIIKKTDG